MVGLIGYEIGGGCYRMISMWILVSNEFNNHAGHIVAPHLLAGVLGKQEVKQIFQHRNAIYTFP